ncbi:MAG: hypothetical protein R3194_02535 [Limnobacter sp.]|nr:hypothetical protein [Limnobacter sp.]
MLPNTVSTRTSATPELTVSRAHSSLQSTQDLESAGSEEKFDCSDCAILCRDIAWHLISRSPRGAALGVVVGLIVKVADLLVERYDQAHVSTLTFPFVTGMGAAIGLGAQMGVDMISLAIPGWCQEEADDDPEISILELRERADVRLVENFMANRDPNPVVRSALSDRTPT